MVEENIQVTVWCLAYNHEKYIRQTLEGFVAQKATFSFEVIIHDDASTDGTQAIIKEYTEKYPHIIKPIFQTENQYSKEVDLLHAFGLPKAKGRYIAFCEGDDYWCDSEKLQKQYEALEDHPEIPMCVARVKCVNEDGSPNERTIPERQYRIHRTGAVGRDKLSDLLFLRRGGYPFHTSTYFIRKAVLEENGCGELFGLINGDQIIMRSALLAGGVYYIDEVLSCRRLFAIGSYNSRLRTMSDSYRMNQNFNAITAEILFNEISEGIFCKKIFRYCYLALFSCAQNYDREESKKKIMELKTKYPFRYSNGIKATMKYVVLMHFEWAFTLYSKVRKMRKGLSGGVKWTLDIPCYACRMMNPLEYAVAEQAV